MPNKGRKNIASSIIWRMTEGLSTKGISFVISIVLARLLNPSEYGVISLVTVFTTLAAVLIQSGLGKALIQRKDATNEDYSTLFTTSIILATILYAILFAIAPFIASYYGIEEVTFILRIIALILFPNAISSILISKLSKQMNFKRLFVCSVIGTVLSGLIGIILAYNGFGTWALIAQQLSNSIVYCITIFLIVDTKPRFFVSWKRFFILFKYSWKITASELIATVNQDIRTLVIGRKYSADMLGQYNRGKQFPHLAFNIIDGALNAVLFPAYSTAQDNKILLKQMMRRSIATSSYIVFPIMMGLAITAEPLVSIILTDKWLPCVPFLQICCVQYALYPVHTANLQAINAIGRSDVFLKLGIIRTVLSLIVLSITVFCFDSIMAIAFGGMFNAPISMIVNSYPNRKLLNYKLEEQLKDMIPSFLATAVMGVFVWLITLFNLSALPMLLIQICTGIILYIGFSWLFKLESFMYLKTILHDMIKRHN